MIGARGYRLSQHEHAIAWGQAMFCRGGSVTPVQGQVLGQE